TLLPARNDRTGRRAGMRGSVPARAFGILRYIMKKSLTLAVTVLLFACGLPAAPADTIPWMDSISLATKQAAETGKPILLYLHADYCVYCKQMEKEAFQDSRAVLLSDEYIPCRMDGEHDGKPLIAKYNVRLYPFHTVIGPTGDILASAPDYMDPDKYVKTLAVSL